MATVVVAVGSNIGDRRQHLADAKRYLSALSDAPLRASSIYITEPIGPSSRDFFNAVVALSTAEKPEPLIKKFKSFEAEHGRSPDHTRWSPRTIDLDIISYDDLVIQTDTLIIPHPEYHRRLFVLEPLQELFPEWQDPRTGQPVERLLMQASPMRIKKTDLRW
ncbi:2-amino-4-hydroxy-6-hydroxymethyldihydropteridine diphosphokinase [Fodinibius sediminis]|uniref:2-amino-4-hydroxy-6-hydroxymethyldihydropteridine diphosphokinase n=1 Tax=Fodinibius sediminis TaxID=1214077 RepID=A0A521CMM3_9BACT|nr:2-amino-4-hydroxy-6-hydroxymethyldihydropteridine diphosphokinase [Fodinibius sediminis]SMO60692.1 2-amino-4-hydroxy-6-hydroxymethyldihydropteridinediphosphokinase [Fodinibius sediminis]